MEFLVQFIFYMINIAFILGISLVILYAIFNSFAQSRSYLTAPRFIRNFVDWLIDFSAYFGPFFIIIFIIGRLVGSLLGSTLG